MTQPFGLVRAGRPARRSLHGIPHILVVLLMVLAGALALPARAQVPAPTLEDPLVINGSIHLKWSEVTGATSYQIYRSNTAGGAGEMIGEVMVKSFVDIIIKDGMTYYYTVKAVKIGTGISPKSNEKSATAKNRKEKGFSHMDGKQALPPTLSEAEGDVSFVSSRSGDSLLISLWTDIAPEQQLEVCLCGPADPFTEGAPLLELPLGNFRKLRWFPTEEQMQWLLSGLLYVEVRTLDYPTGEIRGQVEPIFPSEGE